MLVLVCGRSEKRNHPLADAVLASVAQPVGDARAGDGGLEAVGLRHSPHRHEAAVTPAADAHPISVDGIFPQHFVDAGHDVLEIAIAEVFYVRARERLSLSVTAAGIGKEDEVAGLGLQRLVRAGHIERRLVRRRRSAVHLDDHRILLCRVEVGRIDEEALHVEGLALPLHAYASAYGGQNTVVGVRELPSRSGAADPDLRRRRKGFANGGQDFAIARRGDTRNSIDGANRHVLVAGELHRLGASVHVDSGDLRAPLRVARGDDRRRARPAERSDRALYAWCEIARHSTGGGKDIEIAAGHALIAHQPADVGDGGTVRRPARIGDLMRGRRKLTHLAGRGVDARQLCHPPVVVAGATRLTDHELLATRRPVILVDVVIIGRDRFQIAGRGVDDGKMLPVYM